MKKSTKIILIVVIAIVVLLIVLKLTGAFGKNEGTEVTAEKAQLRTITETVNASGKIYPVEEVKISSEISGELTNLYVKEGDSVKKGQILARVYADNYSIAQQQANAGVAQSKAQMANIQATAEAQRAQLQQAQIVFKQQQQLYKENVISLAEYNQAEANYKIAKANYDAAIQSINAAKAGVRTAQTNLATAQTNLGRTALYAPIDGVVTVINVKVGEQVAGSNFNVGTEIMRIANMNSFEMNAEIGETDVIKIVKGDTASISIDAYPNQKFKGIVTEVAGTSTGSGNSLTAAASNNDVTQYNVTIRILKESYESLLGKGTFPLRSGMSASADIATQTVNNAISVPVNAVTTRQKPDSILEKQGTTHNANNDYDVCVFVVDGLNQAKQVNVTTGIQDLNYIQITSGLQSGAMVITAPYDRVSKSLETGTKVKVVSKDELYGTDGKKKKKKKDSSNNSDNNSN